MEIGGVGDRRLVVVKGAASLCEGGVQVIDCLEVFVDERLVDQRPQVLGGLQLGTIGRLVDQADTVWNGQVFRPVPAGIIEDENDDALAAGTGLAREGFEQFGKERLVDAIRQVPDRFSARRRDKGGEVEPFIAVMAERNRPLADGCPDALTDGF